MFQRLEVTPRATSVSKRSRATPRLRSTTEVIPKSGRSNAPFAIEGFQQRYDQKLIHFYNDRLINGTNIPNEITERENLCEHILFFFSAINYIT